ncbi:MAG TPA: tRNA (5-methylaminomethyl-2-thiouridylate)-methyltransferase, partial [Candidatus Nitrosotalea sp.]|nr:tRNA (5-methylaminomethyl-2-thiouridylate)-methyltransferase [Candidatus Nitrosotalea sp.]
DENEMLKALALPGDVLFDAKDHVGPISLLRGQDSEKNLKLAAAIALRYSDAPKDKEGTVLTEKDGAKSELVTNSIPESEYLQYRI